MYIIQLLHDLGFTSGVTSAAPLPLIKRRKRRSKFAVARLEILRRHAKEESLSQILRALRVQYGDANLPSSRSQLSRYIRQCIRIGSAR